MEAPITPEELQAEINRTFKAARRRRTTGILLLVVGLLIVLAVGAGFLTAEYRVRAAPSPQQQR